MSDQSQLVEGDGQNEARTVYVVATNYDGDPHPHIEGVYSDNEAAEEMMDKCSERHEPPYPVAWQLFEVEVDGEVNLP